jgi:hypothetical protein
LVPGRYLPTRPIKIQLLARWRFLSNSTGTPLFEIVRQLVRFDYVACIIVNADHGMRQKAEKLE